MKGSQLNSRTNALQAYRVMAFTTGVVLLCGTVELIAQWLGDADKIKSDFSWLWVLHGYLYLVYLVATLNLGTKLRWNITRMLLVALAGTVPTMSFVAEHFVTRAARGQLGAPARS